MIVAIKRNKKKLIKILSLLALICMFGGYYFYMNITYAETIAKRDRIKTSNKIEEEKR